MSDTLAVARYLEDVPCVKRVLYPELESSPYHELVKTQMNGLGTGILSFDLADDVNACPVSRRERSCSTRCSCRISL